MPLYEYECDTCGSRFSKLCSAESRQSATCNKCGSQAKLLVSLSNFRLAIPLTVLTHNGKKVDWSPTAGEVPNPNPPTHNLVEV